MRLASRYHELCSPAPTRSSNEIARAWIRTFATGTECPRLTHSGRRPPQKGPCVCAGLGTGEAVGRARRCAGARSADRLNSWATDGHKWLNVPYDSGIVIVREGRPGRSAKRTIQGVNLDQLLDEPGGDRQVGDAARDRHRRAVEVGVEGDHRVGVEIDAPGGDDGVVRRAEDRDIAVAVAARRKG
jgi:hypothetical protein